MSFHHNKKVGVIRYYKKVGYFYFASGKFKKVLDNGSEQEYKEARGFITKSGGLALLLLSRKV
ncbi:MAG TPA: hypothetical protein DCP92_09735 [Nitrospiraceae bacterium]|jgi:hypothetical protein|nr:hypothetical protein [Nitrospiraceae bacterium]